ncbi:hypothetical protein [Radiobacillus sp. PE A8.2]
MINDTPYDGPPNYNPDKGPVEKQNDLIETHATFNHPLTMTASNILSEN